VFVLSLQRKAPRIIVLVGLLVLPVFGPSIASALDLDIPTSGVVYSTKENHSLSYRCDGIDSRSIRCHFVQTTVRARKGPADLSSELEKARRAYAAGELKYTPAECKGYRDFLAIVEGRAPPPDKVAWDKTSQKTRADIAALVRSFAELCSRPSEEAALSLARVSHDKDSRTCLVYSHSFEQVFRSIGALGKRTWVVNQPAPEGACGLVQLSRFHRDSVDPTKPESLFWNYTARKAVTNPTAKSDLGFACNLYDESEYVYVWKDDERQIGCDYISFTMQ